MKYWEVIADKLSAARAPFALLVFVVESVFVKSPAPEVIFISPCECEGFHGKNRWIVKTDFTPVPVGQVRDSIGDTVTDLRVGRTRAGCRSSAHDRSANAVRRKVGLLSLAASLTQKWK